MKITAFKDLTKPKLNAAATIDKAAQARRLKYTTPGMELLYSQKASEATAFLVANAATGSKAPDGDPAVYPLLNAELGITALTMWEVAEVIAQAAAHSKASSMVIEKVRLAAKRQIANAESEAQIANIVTKVKWDT